MQSPRLHWRGQFPRGAVAPGQRWLAVCMAVTSPSRQDIPRLPWPVSVLWQWVLEKKGGSWGAVPGHCGCSRASTALREPGGEAVALHVSRGHCIHDVVVQGDGSGPLGDLRSELCANQELRKEGHPRLAGAPLVLRGRMGWGWVSRSLVLGEAGWRGREP